MNFHQAVLPFLGHWLRTRGAEKEIVYVIKTAAGQETLTPREFYKRFGWKKDPNKVILPEMDDTYTR